MTGRPTILLVLAMALGAAGPASAATWHGRDATRDVVRVRHTYDTGEGSCGRTRRRPVRGTSNVDIAGLAVTHRRHVVVVTTVFTDLAPGEVDLDDAIRTPSGTYEVAVSRQHGRFFLNYFLLARPRRGDCAFPEGPGPRRVGCPAGRAESSDRRDTVRVVVPRSCLGHPAWVRAASQTTAFVGTSGSTVRLDADAWGPHARPAGLHPTFSPRVAAPR